MRFKIDPTTFVVTYETINPCPRNAAESLSYYLLYKDDVGRWQESEHRNGLSSDDHCITEAQRDVRHLSRAPKVEATKLPMITTPYHFHLCTQACGVHRCVNPECEIPGEFAPRQVAEIICPACGEQTGTRDFFERREMKIATYMPVENSQAIVA
jgi:hypothetical protein